MLKIGCHLSSGQGYLAMGKAAKAIGANTFQFFTRNPRGGKAKAFDEADAAAYVAYAAAEGIAGILAHAPYTLNACAADEDLRAFARRVMLEDLQRLTYFPGSMYNFHPGSHVKQGSAAGIEYIGQLLNAVLQPEQATLVLLETMAGKGTEIGRCFEELREIIDRVDEDQLLGVCLDTCHVFDGGYDIVHGLDAVIEEF
ncbi:MAG: deoxyribonuclease IV, partial [Selenomonadaceae bacterium]